MVSKLQLREKDKKTKKLQIEDKDQTLPEAQRTQGIDSLT